MACEKQEYITPKDRQTQGQNKAKCDQDFHLLKDNLEIQFEFLEWMHYNLGFSFILIIHIN